jgi:hypothetical protein
VRKTHRSLSLPGSKFQDLAHEVDGQYLRIIQKIVNVTKTDSWRMLNGSPLTEEQVHTLITTGLAEGTDNKAIGNHMTIVGSEGKKSFSHLQYAKELL